MGIIKDRFKAKADQANVEIKELIKRTWSKKIGEVTLAQAYQGMRGITGLVTETSLLDAQEGIRFRGLTQSLSCRSNCPSARVERTFTGRACFI